MCHVTKCIKHVGEEYKSVSYSEIGIKMEKNRTVLIVLVCCVVCLPVCLLLEMSDQEVTFEEVKALENNKSVLLIDVREPYELEETGIIPGSINIPLATLENTLKDVSSEDFQAKYGREKPNLDFPIVFSCRSGRRSKTALDLAVKLGYTNVKHYPGGWLGWEKGLKNEN